MAKFIFPSVSMLFMDPMAELHIARYARICYGKEDEILSDRKIASMIKMLLQRGHHTPFEMADAAFEVTCSRGVTHELVRHRMASFLQQSQRYMDYEQIKEISFISPVWAYKGGVCTGKWMDACHNAEHAYFALREEGRSPEEAREVLPNSTATCIIIKANLREWMHIFDLRLFGTTGKPHPEMVRIMEMIYPYFEKAHPHIFTRRTDDGCLERKG